jgi:hypothetical protein
MSSALDHSTTSTPYKSSFNNRSVTFSRKANLWIHVRHVYKKIEFQQPYSKTPILSKKKWEVELHNTDNNSLHPALQNRYDSFTKHNNISDRSYSQKTSCRKVSSTTTTYLTDPILQIHAEQFHQPQNIWPILFSKYIQDIFTKHDNISDRSYALAIKRHKNNFIISLVWIKYNKYVHVVLYSYWYIIV